MALRKKTNPNEASPASSPRLETRRRSRRRMQPPLTPMIDVTFQLLLFFLLACEFRETEGLIPGTLPGSGPPEQLRPIEISLHPSGVMGSAYYRLDGAAEAVAGPQELFRRLRQRQEALGSRDVPVLIRPDPDVPWQFVVEAFNQAKRAEFTRIGFPPEPLRPTSRT